MGILSAKEFRQHEVRESLIDVGDGNQILVRRPDLETLVFNGLLPTPLFDDVVKIIAEWRGLSESDVAEDMRKNSATLSAFIDKWVSFACVQPRVVLTPEAAGDDAVFINDLRIETRLRIFAETFDGQAAARTIRRAVLTAAKEFRQDGSGETVGSDVPAVRAETQPDLIHY